MMEAATTTIARRPAQILAGRKLLIIDAEADRLRQLATLLAEAGCQTAAAHDIAEAAKIAGQFRPDIALLVPAAVEIGAACAALKSHEALSATPFILVNARDIADARIRALDAGAADSIGYPYDRDQVLGRIAVHLRMKADREQSSHEQALQHQAQRLETVGTLAGGVAHEFNNLAAGIIGYAELALATGDVETLRKSAEVAAASGRRIAGMARSLHRFASPSTGLRALIDLNDIVNETLDLLRAQLENDNIELQVQLGAAPAISGDAPALREALLHLVTNARQALLPQENLRRITVATSAADDQVILTVADNGPGIPDHLLQRIFDPFFTTKGVFGGGNQNARGLGLTVVEATARAHGGHAEIHSEPQRETRVTLTLPRLREGEIPPRSARVLVVDDDPVILAIFRHFLKNAGHKIDLAAGGTEAINKIRAGDYDVALLDWMMPQVCGRDVLQAMRDMNSSLPVVVVTAGYSKQLAQEAMSLGARECTGKPLNHRKVVHLVERYAGLPPRATGPIHDISGQGECVLVIECDPMLADLYRMMLKWGRYEPIVAAGVDSARNAVAREYFNLIMIDSSVAKVGGVEFMQELKRMNPYTPVLLIAEDQNECVSGNIADFVRKPLQFTALLEKIRGIIDIYREPCQKAL